MKVFSIDGIVPVVDPSAFVHPSAVLIGDVIIGPRCYIGPNASLRGDFGRVVMQAGSNLQDTCVMHAFPGLDVVIEMDGHVGHGAVLHGLHRGLQCLDWHECSGHGWSDHRRIFHCGCLRLRQSQVRVPGTKSRGRQPGHSETQLAVRRTQMERTRHGRVPAIVDSQSENHASGGAAGGRRNGPKAD